jgi:hypothetical protein
MASHRPQPFNFCKSSRDPAVTTLVPIHSEATVTLARNLQVWPWLVQMGVGRAGWDRVDNGGEPSADRIGPEWQNLEVGQRLNTSPDGQKWMTVAAVEPNRTSHKNG